jgi:uncharacterized protein (TIGR03790 family)
MTRLPHLADSRFGRKERSAMNAVFKCLMVSLVINTLQLLSPPLLLALSPGDLLIVSNRSVPESAQLARYYMKRRNVPPGNNLPLKTSSGEQISRKEFDQEIASPLRDFIKKNDPDGNRFKCIVLMYGMPLRILPSGLSEDGKSHLVELRKSSEDLSDRIKAFGTGNEKQVKALREELSAKQRQIRVISISSDGASVDSEIALVMENHYSLAGWLPNRFFAGFRGKEISGMPQKVMLVSRLDGSSEAVVRRIIDDSMEVENSGLAGKAYFDARWPEKDEKNPTPYQTYDRAIHNTAHILRKNNKMPVVLDEQEKLFQPGEAPDAAFYCGWYSLAKYVDAFKWAQGAVGFHVASAECTTLKNRTSRVWCKSMLEKGVAATIGPVAEPYLQSFPSPEIFFACLIDGRLALAECYALANPFWSWQMVLIGDPLYRPFKHRTLSGN